MHSSNAQVGGAAFELPLPDLGEWRRGNTGVEGVWSFDSGQSGRHVMITALIHGNELCGAWALQGLLASGLRPRRGRLTLAFCNLDAFDRFDAQNHDASRFVEQDLNRQWIADRMAEGSTLERRRASALAPFVRAADWLLDLHSMHEPSSPLIMTGLLRENIELALQMKTNATLVVDGGHEDGVRMRDFEHFGTAAGAVAGARALLVECGFHGDLASRSVAQDHCLRFLERSGAVPADELAQLLPNWRLPDAEAQPVLEVTGAEVAQTASVRFVENYQGLEHIAAAGTVIGHDGPRAIETPHDDCVLVQPSIRQARLGVTVVRYARRQPRQAGRPFAAPSTGD